jgi:hypothetical protein
VVLGVLVALLIRVRGGNEGATSPQSPVGPAFSAVAVREISFRRGDIFVRVVREGDGFWIVEPYRDRAAEEMIAQSLRVAATIEPLRTLPDTTGAPFGLDHPSAIWKCRWDGGEYSIEIGDSIPAGGGRYARRSGSAQIVVVDPFLVRRFLAPPVQDVHSMTACPVDVGPIDSVRIATREEKIVIVRRRPDYWEIVAPIHAEASAPEVTRAVQNLRTTTMSQVLGPAERFDLRPMGLEPPRAVWTLVQGRTRSTARIGSPTPDQRNVHVIPSGRDVVGWIGSESFRAWVDGTARLRESRMLWASPESVVAVVVQRGGTRRSFIKVAGRGWREQSERDTLDVRQDAMSQAVENLCALRAVAYQVPGASPVGGPPLTVRMRMGDSRGDSLVLFEPRAGAAAALGTRQSGPCMVSEVPFRTWSLWLERPLRP